MGNSQSARSFLNADPDFGEYVHAEWRSQRAAELDALGGLGRPPLLLGQSFDAKMMFLGNQLQQQGQKMQEIILPQKPSSARGGAPNSAHATNPKVNRAFFLNTDRRLAIRRGELVPPDAQAVEALEALGVHSGKAVHVHQLDLKRLKDQNKADGSFNHTPSKDVPAEWRKRVHKARRNAFLLVLTMNRLKRGHSYPKRIPYVEDLNFTIPQALGEDCPRFIEVQQRCGAIRQTIRGLKTELEELLRCSTDDIGAALPTAHSPRLAAAPHSTKPSHALPAGHSNALALDTTNGAHTGGSALSPAAGIGDGGASIAASGVIALPPALMATAPVAGPAPYSGAHHTLAVGGATSAAALLSRAATEVGGVHNRHGDNKSGGESVVGAPAPAAGGHAATVRLSPSRPPAAPAAAAAADSPVKRTQALPTVQEGSSHPTPTRKPSPSSARYASPSRRPWGVNPGAQLGSVSANARARPGGTDGSLISSTSTRARRASSGDEEGRGGDGITRAYPKPWKVGAALGGEARKEEGEDMGRAGSARSKLAPLPAPLPPPRHAAQKLLQSGTEQALVPSHTGHAHAPKLARQCSLPPLREASSSSEGSSEDANSAAWSPAEDGGHLATARTSTRGVQHHSPKLPRQLSLDKSSRGAAEASQPGLLVPPQVKLQPLQGMQHNHYQHQHEQQQQQQQQQQSNVQGEGSNHHEHPPAKAVDRRARLRELGVLIDEQYFQLRKARDMLSMFVNRANGGWTEAQKWEPPDVASSGDVLTWTKTDQFAIYKADAIRQLRLGQIAVQLMVGEDALSVPQSQSAGLHIPPGHKRAPVPNSPTSSQPQSVMQDLWTSDPWELIDQCRPTVRTAIHRLEGLSLGGRAVAQMVLSLQTLAGEEAVKRLHVLLHVNEDQEEEVVAELHQHKWFGLSPEHVLIVMTQRRPSSLRFNAEDLAFLPDVEPGSTAAWAADSVGASTTSDPHQQGPRTFGTGHAMMQLGWAGHAYTIGPEGLHQPVHLSVLELLQSQKVQWVLSRRARDLGLLTKEGVFDLSQLAHALYLRDQARATAIMEVCFSSSQSVARQHDSVIMQQKSSAGGATDVSSISDLRQSDIVSKNLMSILDGQCRVPGSKGLALGLGRCLYYLPALTGTMTSLAVFRPRLQLHKECISVNLDAADLISHGKARARAVEARSSPGLLTAHSSLDALLPLLQAQDHDATFHDLVMDMVEHPEQEATSQARMVTHQDLAQPPGTPIIVFIARNGVAASAVNVAANLARAGRDKVILVTFVPTSMQQSEGEELLAIHRRGAFRTMAQVETEVVVRGPLGLLDSMERFVEQRSAAHGGQRPLVVMGSVQITSALFCYVAGSVTLSFIRRCGGIPVVVVTANSKQVPEKAGMRCLALVEGHSRAMMTHLCRNIVQESRGDRLLLTQVLATTNLTRQQQANYRRLLDSFYQIANSNLLPVQKALVGDGPLDKVLCSVVEDHGVGLLALQLLPGTKAMPQHMLALLRSCRCATLIYSDAPARASMLRKSGALRTSMRLLHSELAKVREAIAAENGETQGER
uniref:Uncharacterized protein n=1 Tax=Dunaliella tertiolecta TaxID=3047 RepID=A0A7S3VS70_DUNTE|mmetsp:Transcript_23290/g.64348  ORF Transcript_23290/g.64348 Transcript_23290/m.64348 type:complete len:1547 (+) Transcript_23290:83-4723(+)|eukprot:CAMPEP_0202372238 /NCGR_PEP_ID=MMETSP1127-20130417/3457_1 /ASSEMBLY_ACC=CAM_ASM_000462 /TAXON_ID=3047 /ORGANISM="Dunaliella tertiolecta, Strain CCMP1320" /LENGTH=1546 /DNA_ID=CAMNT_0048968701 /DNA_START=143 /DNA_END=4783 /DNA_ORIENTATION=-